MNIGKSMPVRALYLGAIWGIAMGIYMLLEFAVGLHTTYLEVGQYVGFLRYIILFVGILLAIRSISEKFFDGEVRYWKAVGIGVLVSVSAGVVMGVFEYAYAAWIAPDFFERFLEMHLQAMRESGASDAAIAEAREGALMWSAPHMNFLLYFVETIVFGFGLSLIAAIFRTKREPAATPNQITTA